MPVQMYSLAHFDVELATTGAGAVTVDASCSVGTVTYTVETKMQDPPATACNPYPAAVPFGTRRSITVDGVADEAEAASVVEFLEDHAGAAGTLTLTPKAGGPALPTIVFPVAAFVEASVTYPADDTATITTEAMYLSDKPTRTPPVAAVA